MMDSPFFRNRFVNSPSPRYSPSASRSVHVHMPSSPAAVTPKRKVISVPVVSVESERKRSLSALMIQKLFRGFLVRKSMKKIMAIRSEVKEIERRLSLRETMDLIRRDSKERLKVNEMLMALLFRLDSVRGVDSGVRDCRKAVIKKAIALQEAVDAIVVEDQVSNTVDCEESDETVDVQKSVHCEIVADPKGEMQCQGSGSEDSVDRALHTIDCKETDDQQVNDSRRSDDETLEIQNSGHIEIAANPDTEVQCKAPGSQDSVDQAVDNVDCKEIVRQESSHGEMTADRDTEMLCQAPRIEVCVDRAPQIGDSRECDGEALEFQDSGACGIVVDLLKSEEDSVNRTLKIVNAIDSDGVENETMEIEAQSRDTIDNPEESGEVIKSVVEKNEIKGVETKGESKDNGEMLKRLAEDNARLMSLMNEFLEKNETHTRMLRSLRQRVQRLESAFVCDKLRRKKRQGAATVTDPPDQKKFGKK